MYAVSTIERGVLLRPRIGCNTAIVDKTKRPYHHGDLRTALLQAAERAVERDGIENMSLRELSREIGVSNTAPRRHFATKQVLLDALAVQGFDRLGRALTRAVTDRDLDFDTRLLKLARAHIRFATRHPAMVRLMFAVKHHPEATPQLLEASARALAAGPLAIASGQTTGAVVQGDQHLLALTVFAAVEGLVTLCADGEFGGLSLDRLTVEVVGRIILGLRPRPQTANTPKESLI